MVEGEGVEVRQRRHLDGSKLAYQGDICEQYSEMVEYQRRRRFCKVRYLEVLGAALFSLPPKWTSLVVFSFTSIDIPSRAEPQHREPLLIPSLFPEPFCHGAQLTCVLFMSGTVRSTRYIWWMVQYDSRLFVNSMLRGIMSKR